MDDDDPEDGPFAAPPLPEGVTQLQVNDLIRAITDAAELVGLYADPTIGIDSHHDHSPEGECGEDELVLHVRFRIGQVAFTKRVQDPIQDKTDTAFHQIESEETSSRVEDIKARFRRGNQNPT